MDTTGLAKLTVLTDADCTAMREVFGRCSALLHSQPGEINRHLPAPSAIEADIDALEKWIADIRSGSRRPHDDIVGKAFRQSAPQSPTPTFCGAGCPQRPAESERADGGFAVTG
jgi:hypothetical protein